MLSLDNILDKHRGRWWFFLGYLVMHCIGSAIIAGGLEFAIAYGMYKRSRYRMWLWAFPNTLSGDCALSLFIQVIVTWFSEECIIGRDSSLGHAPTLEDVPLAVAAARLADAATPAAPAEHGAPSASQEKDFSSLDSEQALVSPSNRSVDNPLAPKKWRFLRWYLQVDRGILPRQHCTTREFYRALHIHYPDRSIFFNLLEWTFHVALRSFMWSCVCFCFVWPVTVGILAGIGHKVGSHEYTFNHYPLPQVMKLLYAVTLGFAGTSMAVITILLRNHFHLLESKRSNASSIA